MRKSTFHKSITKKQKKNTTDLPPAPRSSRLPTGKGPRRPQGAPQALRGAHPTPLETPKSQKCSQQLPTRPKSRLRARGALFRHGIINTWICIRVGERALQKTIAPPFCTRKPTRAFPKRVGARGRSPPKLLPALVSSWIRPR